jgi:hypothetical protein
MAQTNQSTFALDNLTYDLIAILHEKSQALEAYQKYHQDAQGDQKCGDLLKKIHQQDRQDIIELQQCLAERLQKSVSQHKAA